MFALKCAISKLRYSKKICLIFILSIAAGLVCPIYVLGYIHTSEAKAEMNRIESAEDYMLVNGQLPFMTSSGLANMSRIIGTDLEDYECVYQTTVNWGEADGVAFVGGVSAGILERVPVYLQEGRLFDNNDYTQDAIPVCILMDNSVLYLAGARSGDTVSFMGNSYEVVGVIDGWGANLIGSILIPYPQMYYVSGESAVQHRFIVPRIKENMEESIKAQTQMMFDVNIYSVTSLAEEERLANEAYAAQNRTWLLAGLAVCLFAFLSIFAISAGRSLEERRMLGIHKAMGATSGVLFFEVFIQNLVLVALALLLDGLILALPLENIFRTKVEYGPACLLEVCGLGVALALILSLVSIGASGKPVQSLIKGQEQ